MVESLNCSDAVVRVFLEHLPEEVQCFRVHRFVLLALKQDITGSVLRKHFVVSLPRERADSKQQYMEDEPQAEDIANGLILGLHILDVDDLRSHVARRAASDKQILLRVCELGQSEIRNRTLETTLGPEENVLRLQVPMHDLLAVHFLETLQDGEDGSLHLRRPELVLRLHLVIQLAALEQLHDNIQRVLGLEDFI